jgi:hypothetical protein
VPKAYSPECVEGEFSELRQQRAHQETIRCMRPLR